MAIHASNKVEGSEKVLLSLCRDWSARNSACRGAARHSPTNGEVPALAAGIRHWQDGGFELFRVNPPLIRMVAASSVLFLHPATDWSRSQDVVGLRPEFDVGEDSMRENGGRAFWFFTVARWACLPVSTSWVPNVCFAGRELYGFSSGMVALILWCFSPNIIAHAQLISWRRRRSAGLGGSGLLPFLAMGLLAKLAKCRACWLRFGARRIEQDILDRVVPAMACRLASAEFWEATSGITPILGPRTCPFSRDFGSGRFDH